MLRFDLLCLSSLIVFAGVLSGCSTDDGPDLILHNGHILTVD